MNVFIAALDWGLGHATRIIPIIQKEINEGHNVIIGTSVNQLPIYKEHFPEIHLKIIPSSPPVYSTGKFQFLHLVFYIPRFLKQIISEHNYLKDIIEQHKIQKVISDNCYGLYNSNTNNIIITHQLNIPLPHAFKPFRRLVNKLIHRLINNFDTCLIPDFSGKNNLSGLLTFPLPELKCDIVHINPLTRLTQKSKDEHLKQYPKVLILISGPEKQRSVFENLIINSLKEFPINKSYLIIRGLPNEIENNIENSINHLLAYKLANYIKNADYIICRAGYSTIMDLSVLNKTAVLVPTPGQPEQEYLAKHLSRREKFLSIRQNNLCVSKALEELESFILNSRVL